MKLERPLPVDGQPPRITELWAWTAIDPMTDVEGILAATGQDGIRMPLVTGTRVVAERLRPYAEAAAAIAEEPRPVVRLRHFVPAEEDQ